MISMEYCYILKIDTKKEIQNEKDLSFIGGLPRLPLNIELPKCSLCNEQQTFIFQISFPDEHIWSGLSMAVFACTSCAKEGYFIPEMLKGQLKDINIPKGFLEKYQCNFKTLVFKTEEATIRTDYREKVKFKKWKVEKVVNNKRKVIK